MAKYTLMHKNIAVVDIELMNDTAAITQITTVYNLSHLPVGVCVNNGKVDRNSLNIWFKERSIPAYRDGLCSALEPLGRLSSDWLIEKCYGLSLSDQYWINPVDNPLKWSEVNFFEHHFSEDVGNLLFNEFNESSIDLMSPDNTTDGWLKKRWRIIDGKRCLVKAGSGAYHQEAYNEVIASIIMEKLNIAHIPEASCMIVGKPTDPLHKNKY